MLDFALYAIAAALLVVAALHGWRLTRKDADNDDDVATRSW